MQTFPGRRTPSALSHLVPVVALVAILAGCQGADKSLAPSLDGAQLDRSGDQNVEGKIVFHSSVAGNVHIFAMNADGTEQSQLTRTPTYDFEPVWSPNGKQVVYITCFIEAQCCISNA